MKPVYSSTITLPVFTVDQFELGNVCHSCRMDLSAKQAAHIANHMVTPLVERLDAAEKKMDAAEKCFHAAGEVGTKLTEAMLYFSSYGDNRPEHVDIRIRALIALGRWPDKGDTQ